MILTHPPDLDRLDAQSLRDRSERHRVVVDTGILWVERLG